MTGGTAFAAYSQTLTASSANGGTAPYTFSVTSGTLPAGLSLTAAGALTGTPSAANTSSFTVQAVSANGFTGTQAYSLTIAKANQTITFGAQPGQTYAPGGTFTINPVASASSGLAVSYAVSPNTVCTLGSGTTVNIIGAGTCAITASQAGNANYNAATSVTQNVTIAKANQTITFNAQPGQTYTPGGTFSISPVATASSGLPVSYAVSPNTVCTLGSGTTVNIIGAGTCAITASQTGNANYNAATAVTQNVTIAKAAQTLTFPAQTRARRTFVDGGTFSINPVATSASPNSGSAITYSSLTPLVCTVSGTTVSMLKPGTCTIAADQAGNSNYLDAPQVTQDVVIVPATTAIPTLNEWGLMLMGLLAAGLGMRRLRRW
ncbi:MAG TPA: IPTL-CTERM sorting domain-containing protein [Ottowia sp.]|nr:IPTL-CTERM sorting domain-containing protein [Ottowia sp.]HPZ58267.1 IPTL-CTERM sorting domain-containing protein [Ottowia sp.]HQD49243.1 IPTL-CTERM sorting domain-containing protein [Ottowia sp.]